MVITKFSVENWIGNHNKDCVKLAHSWQEIEAAIKELDGHHQTLVTLETDGETHMAVGGGQNKYVVYVTFDNENFHYLVDPSKFRDIHAKSETKFPKGTLGFMTTSSLRNDKSNMEVSLTVGGQEGVYPAKSCVDLNTTLKAAKTFAEFGVMEESVSWETDEVFEQV